MNPTPQSSSPSTPDLIGDVAEFQAEVLGLKPTIFAFPDQSWLFERARFLEEEVEEMMEAYEAGNPVTFVDALADQLYVILGMAYQCGVPMAEVWAAVQRANMRKEPGMTKRGMKHDAMKPEGWVGPEQEIAQALADQRKLLQPRDWEGTALPRYVLHPGYVRSFDGDEHFVDGPRLAELYGVRLRECMFGDVPGYHEQAGDVHLWPRADGRYQL